MKKIKLTRGMFALVDDEDFEYLNQFNWMVSESHNMFYAVGILSSHRVRGVKHKVVKMHQVIMRTPKGKCTDHINRNGLDNRKKNLRICTNAENCKNTVSRKGFTSIYKGVCRRLTRNVNKNYYFWVAQITLNYKVIHLGHFEKEVDAARAYNKKAKELFGEFASLNKIRRIK